MFNSPILNEDIEDDREYDDDKNLIREPRPCLYCHGTGHLDDVLQCPDCDGQGDMDF